MEHLAQITAQSQPPIFILGLSQRCGTNFLLQLLRLHPHIKTPERFVEDNSLRFAQHLIQYIDRSAESSHETWNDTDSSSRALLARSLGQGLLNMLSTDAAGEIGQRLLTKTPNITNADLFFTLFPEAYLLIVIRDGRDVVESAVRTFRWTYEDATQYWRKRAKEFLAFDRANQDRGLKYRVIRYEDLVNDLDQHLRALLEFLDLDIGSYDFEAARQLPVYGSSTFRGNNLEVNWKPVPKTRRFAPLKRWETWSGYRRQRFFWSTYDLMSELGYPPDMPKRAVGLWAPIHVAIDLWTKLTLGYRRLYRRWKHLPRKL